MKKHGPGAADVQRQPAAVPAAALTQWGDQQTQIDQSPRMRAQGHAVGAMFGPAAQRKGNGLEEEALQARAAPRNETGMPDRLKAGVETLSGMDLSAVRVHRNSTRPAVLQAHAYAQGSDIHLGTGQEAHLPHEAWHVVQQMQGRVKPTVQARGLAVNDSASLEHEADLMGSRARDGHGNAQAGPATRALQLRKVSVSGGVVQCNLGTFALTGSASGAFGNLFGTSTFDDIRSKLQLYQASAVDAEKVRLLGEIQTLGQKWLGDNQKKTEPNAETKRDSIRRLLNLVKDELATRDNSAQYFKEAKGFENRLGLYLFNLPAATRAARQSLDKMSEVMGVEADNDKAAQVFGGDDPKYAGNVGKSILRVMDVINSGNLRERMTAFYNASLGPFKNMIQDHIRLSGEMAGQSWGTAKTSLATKGVGPSGVQALEGRRNEIADYPNKWGYSLAKQFDKSGQLLDVYKAPGDRFTRSDDDALLRGQKGILEKEGREEAFNVGAFTSDAFNFNFDAFDFTADKLLGTASGSVFKTFAGIQSELDLFWAATADNDKLFSYNKLWSLSNDWIKANVEKTDANSQTKRQSLKDMQAALRKVYSSSSRKPADLRSGPLDASLSEREKEFIMSKSPSHNVEDPSAFGDMLRELDLDSNIYDETQNLPWEEGGTRFTASLRNDWVKEAVEKLKMPVVAGPSGTTDRMLQALKYLGIWNNPVVPDEFRLSLLGWMLTSNDHSFHEIMAVSKSFGLSYKAGSYAYHHIPPLGVQDIRDNVCVNKNFPDEIVYQRLWPNFELVQNELARGSNPMATHGNLSALNPAKALLSPVAAASIKMYTGGAYLVENPAREGGALAGAKIAAAVETNKHGQLTPLKGRVDAGLVGIDDLQAEAAIHNPILENALMDLPAYNGTTYRGQADFLRASYAIGDTCAFNKFTSSSKVKSEAIRFMEKGIVKAPVFVRLNVTGGKDISSLSRYPAEAEVLLPPGSNFQVTNVEHDITDASDGVPRPKRPYTRITMQEV